MDHLEIDAFLLMQTIHKIVQWLDSLLDEKNVASISAPTGQRIFCKEECEYLSLASRHYLQALEHQGVLTPVLREHIIHHAMLLEIKNMEQPVIEGITRILLGKELTNSAALIPHHQLLPWSNHSIH